MILNGKHKRNLYEFPEKLFVDCIVVLEHGKLQKVKFPKEDISFSYLVEDQDDFTIEKYSNKGVDYYFVGTNYILTYKSESGKQEVFLKLNWFEFWKMKFATKTTLLQSKDIKMEVLKYLVIGAIAWFVGSFSIKKCTSIYQNIRNDNPNPIAADSTERKASSKMKDSVPLTDSLQVE